MRRWSYPITFDRHGLAVEPVSFDALVEDDSDFDIEDVEDVEDVEPLAWPVLLVALKNFSVDEWRGIVHRLEPQLLHLFAGLLKEHVHEGMRAVGKVKYATIKGEVFLRRLGHPEARWSLSREVAFEQARLRYIRNDWKKRNPLAPPIPYTKLAEGFGVTDKTIKRWEKEGRM